MNDDRTPALRDDSATSSSSASVVRWALPLAAIVVLGAALTMINREPPAAPAPVEHVDTARGTDLQAVAPAGATDQLREFTWQSPIRADRYRVVVRRGAHVIWQGETTELHLAPPTPGTIERDVQYEWRVEALDREGGVRLTSPPQSFVVY